MLFKQKLKLLKSMLLLNHMPERSLEALAKLLKLRELTDAEVVFKEGSEGMSIYFVSNGRIRIYKQASGGFAKELAVVGPGDFFGEMALIDEVPRSASAAAVGPCLLFELFRGDLERWLKTSSREAVQLFAELSHVQSRRLRRTSSELTLLFDICKLLTDSQPPPPQLLGDVLERMVSHFDGAWSAAIYGYVDSGGGIEPLASHGSFHFDEVASRIGRESPDSASWSDDETFHTTLTSKGNPIGYLIVRAPTPVNPAERDDLARTLNAVCYPIATALQIINFSNAASKTAPADQ